MASARHRRYALIFISFLFTGGCRLDNQSIYDHSRADRERNALIRSISRLSNISKSVIAQGYQVCGEVNELQDCINAGKESVLYVPRGSYELTEGLRLPSGSTVVIDEEAVITLSNVARMPKRGGYVMGLIGLPKKPVRDVTLIINGIIDGNKSVHEYSRSGNECVKVDFGQDILIAGSGLLRNCSGDGIDMDATRDSVVMGLEIADVDGTGVHFGSPRPIVSSKNNVVIGTISRKNGYLHRRSGYDVSWPNYDAATYAWSKAIDNYQNWDISGAGSSVYRSSSVGGVIADDLSGAVVYEINGRQGLSWNDSIDYKLHILRIVARSLAGSPIPSYLKELKFFASH